MPAKKIRTRTTPKTTDATRYPAGEFTLTLREITESKDGFQWNTYLVQGWREGAAWKRRKFKDHDDALAFIYRKQVELANESTVRHHVLTHLDDDQLKDAEEAFHRLKTAVGDRYTVREAVDFYIVRFGIYPQPERNS
jgi:hypothetical protein